MAVAAAERKEVQQMIEMGKRKGHLTVDDINALLPTDVTSPDQIDEFMETLEQAGIEVILDAKARRKGGKGGKAAAPAAKPAPEPREEKKEEESEEAPQEDYGKSNDPVRMY